MNLFKWTFILIIIVIIVLIVYCIISNKNKPESIDNKIVIALIGSLTAIISIIGSVYVNQQLSNENAIQQRAVDIRELKQEYYHKFTEAFLLRITFLPNQKSKEFIEADKSFCIEKNRLPLYASQEIVEYVDSVASGKTLNADFKTLFEMIRKDLKSGVFNEFENLKHLSVTLPAENTRMGSK